MMQSPFAFLPRICALMPRTWQHSDLGHPLAGLRDAHYCPLGGFATLERRVIIDINDFDETLAGPVGVGRQAPGCQHVLADARLACPKPILPGPSPATCASYRER
jgi:hypothetical protein